MDNLAGKTVRGYELRDLIGQGGFGAVYRAYQPAVAREVAIKVILPQYANQPQFIRSFETEAQLVARLEHPHIVPLYDYWQDEETGAFIVMRFLRGGNLRRVLSTQGKFTPSVVVRILDQIAGALTAAHRGGVVHRDLKPDNILLDEEGNAYLTDFGIAKPVGQENTSDQVSGSLAYMSPEQLMGIPPTPLADLYSLGIIIYELLAGEHPFGGIPPTQMILKHVNEELPDLATMPLSFTDFIRKVTAKQEDKRFQDALTVALEFRNVVYPDYQSTRHDVQELMADIKPPVNEQGTILQDQIDKLYRELSDLYERVSETQRVTEKKEVQSEIDQVRREIEFRAASLSMVGKHAVPEMPLQLRLPAPASHELVGAEDERAEAKAALLQNKSVVLLGPSGVGKSEIAAAIARDEEVQQHFEHRVVWFPLGKKADVFTLLGEWLMALGVQEDKLTALTQVEQRKQRLHEITGSRPTLVVVDDLWNLNDFTGSLLDKRSAFVYLITTRLAETAADLLWRVVRLDALSIEGRLKLLQQLVPELATDEDVQNLVTRVGGLPRDLILMGTRLRRAGSTASRLKREVEKLTKSPLDIFEPGYEALGLSVETLSDDARRTFRALAILPPEPNSISEDAADAICGDLAYADELVDASLLRADDGYYTMHPSFNEYARRNLPDEAEDYERILDYFIDYTRKNPKDFNALGRESRNLEACVSLAAERHLDDQLVEQTQLLGEFWHVRGMVQVALRSFEIALRSEGGTPLQRAELYYRMSLLLHQSGDYEGADQQLTLGEDELAKLNSGDPKVVKLASTLGLHRGRILYAQRRLEEAQTAFFDLIEKGEKSRDYALLASAYNNLATAAINARDTAKAKDYYLKAVEAGRKTNDHATLILPLQNLGLLEGMYFQNFAQAKKYLSESFEYAHRLGYVDRMSDILRNRGILEANQHNYQQARVHHEEALQKAKLAHNHFAIATAKIQLGNVSIPLGDFDKGEQYLRDAVEYSQKLDNPYLAASVIDVLTKLGETRILEQQLNFNHDAYHTVLNTLRAMNFEPRRIERLHDLMERLDNPPDNRSTAVAQAQLNLGLIEGREFYDFEQARKHFAESINHARKAGNQPLLLEALLEDAYAAIQLAAFEDVEGDLQQVIDCAPNAEIKGRVTDLLVETLEKRAENNVPADAARIAALTQSLSPEEAERVNAVMAKHSTN